MQFSFRQQSGPSATTNIEPQPSFDKNKKTESTVGIFREHNAKAWLFVNGNALSFLYINLGGNNISSYSKIINNGPKIAFKQ